MKKLKRNNKMLHSIKSLTTELKAVHLNLVILICIWMSCVYVPLVCARGKDVWRAPSIELVPPFPAVIGAEVGARRGRQAARPPRDSRQEKPWKSGPGIRAWAAWRCSAGWEQAPLHGGIRWGWPGSARCGWKWAYRSSGIFGCCSCNWDTTCPFTH